MTAKTTRARERSAAADESAAHWRPSNHQFRLLLAGLHEGVAVFSRSSDVLYLNPAALHLQERGHIEEIRMEPERFDRLFDLCYLDGSPVPHEERPLARLEREESFSEVEMHTRQRETGETWVSSWSGSLIEDGEILGLLTVRDVTAREQAQERFSKTFHHNPVPTFIAALEGLRLLEANREFFELTGYEADELMGRSLVALGVLDPKPLKSGLEEPVKLDNLPLHTKGGERRFLIAAFAPLQFDDEGAVLGTLTDITERKRTEEELVQAIQMVMTDTSWFSQAFMEKLAQLRSPQVDREKGAELAELTPRERQVLTLMATGHSNEAICAELGLAKNTVRNYITRIFSKLGVQTRVEAVIWARQRGLVTP